MKRRSFLLPLFSYAATLLSSSAMEISDEYKRGGFAVGCQAYTSRNFTALEAIERTAKAGGRVIEFYPGQPFSPDRRDLRWNHEADDEMISEIEEQLKRFNIKAINYGVVGIPADEKEARKIFEFAKRLGIQGITTESENALDTIEKLVKEYDIKVAFHNHPRRSDNPN